MFSRCLVGVLLFSLSGIVSLQAQQAQGPLTDQRVYELIHAGVSTAEVLRIISTARQIAFDLRPESTDALTKGGVSDDVIKAMAARESGHALPVPLSMIVPSSWSVPPSTTRRLLKNETPPPNPASSDKPRVFVQGSNDAWSFELSKNGGRGGSHPQTVEVMKTFGQSCPNVIVTNVPQNAQYTVAFERESSKVWRRDNKMVVFSNSGDMVYSASTRELGNAVRGFCASIR